MCDMHMVTNEGRPGWLPYLRNPFESSCRGFTASVMVRNSNEHSCVVTLSEETGEHSLNGIKKKVQSSICTDPDPPWKTNDASLIYRNMPSDASEGIWNDKRKDESRGESVREKVRTRLKKDTPDTPVVLMDFLIKSSSRGMAALYFTPDLLLLNTLFHSSKVSRRAL